MCDVNCNEALKFLQPIITAVGIISSVLIAIFLPRHQKKSDRLVYANIASKVLEEAFSRICDRLEIRFDTAAYVQTGRKMRQYRSDGAIAALIDLKVEDLPVELIPSFSSIRSSLRALNEGMNQEKEWPPKSDDIERYRVVFDDACKEVATFNATCKLIKSEQVMLSPLAGKLAKSQQTTAPTDQGTPDAVTQSGLDTETSA